MAIKIGSKAPEIALEDQKGRLRKSNDLGRKILVLYFYPKDNTPGCTAEACSFRDSYDAFKKLGAEVWGVSSDDEESHRKFSEKYNLQFPILCDKKNQLRKEFQVPNSLGIIPGRVTFVIDQKRIIRHIFNDLFNGPAHVKEAIQAIQALKSAQ